MKSQHKGTQKKGNIFTSNKVTVGDQLDLVWWKVFIRLIDITQQKRHNSKDNNSNNNNKNNVSSFSSFKLHKSIVHLDLWAVFSPSMIQ